MFGVTRSHALALFILFNATACSTFAFAQEAAAPQAPAAAVQATPLARSEGESIRDYFLRVASSDQYAVSGAVVASLKETPSVLSEISALALDEAASDTLKSEIQKGLITAVGIDPVNVAQAVSAAVLADIANVGRLIAVARNANSIPLSETFGEGLALAANTLRGRGEIAQVAAVQTQATARDAPLALSETFFDNFLQTAAGNATFAGFAASGGDIANNTDGSVVSNGGTGEVATSTATAQVASTGRSVSFVSYGTSGTASASATNP